MSDTDEGITPDPENMQLAMQRLKYKDGYEAGFKAATKAVMKIIEKARDRVEEYQHSDACEEPCDCLDAALKEFDELEKT